MKSEFFHTCTKCNQRYQQSASWINPNMYSSRDKAVMVYTFWCPKCEASQSVELKMHVNARIEKLQDLQYKDLHLETNQFITEEDEHEDLELLKLID